jgi:hypothetical protein
MHVIQVFNVRVQVPDAELARCEDCLDAGAMSLLTFPEDRDSPSALQQRTTARVPALKLAATQRAVEACMKTAMQRCGVRRCQHSRAALIL